MPTAGQVANFQGLLGRIARHAGAAVAAMFGVGDVHNYPKIVDPYLAASAQVSAAWYHSLAPEIPFRVEPGPLPPAEALLNNVDYAMTTTEPAQTLQGATDRHIFETSGLTVAHNADREGVKYARYASANACAFCRVLATRNAVYTSEAAATRVGSRGSHPRGSRPIGASYHDNCHCIAVPVRPGDAYRPPDYVDQWQRDYEAARRDPDVHTFDDVVNHMRRTQYARDTSPFKELTQQESPFSALSQNESPFSALSQR
jgi:hypothetical protein